MLHLLGFDHEIGEEAEKEMEEEEELLLKSLGWKGKGLIQSAYEIEKIAKPQPEKLDGKFPLFICIFKGDTINIQFTLAKTTLKRQEEWGWPKILQTQVLLYIL